MPACVYFLAGVLAAMCPEVKQLQTVVIFVEESKVKSEEVLDVFMKSICQDYLNREITGKVQLRSGKWTEEVIIFIIAITTKGLIGSITQWFMTRLVDLQRELPEYQPTGS